MFMFKGANCALHLLIEHTLFLDGNLHGGSNHSLHVMNREILRSIITAIGRRGTLTEVDGFNYESTRRGAILEKTEMSQGGTPIVLPRPHAFPIPELAGEPYPCGGTIGAGGPRLIEAIQENQNQGRYYAAYQEGGTWRRGLVTMATTKGWTAEAQRISQYYGDETILFPPVYAANFSSRSDAIGLAQLIWYMTTGTHPWLAAENLRWVPSWAALRHTMRERQPWTGPAVLGPLLERALFGSPPMPFDELVAGLRAL
jgi:hypothetical protein